MPYHADETADISALDDFALFNERRRVRELLEHLPERHADRSALRTLHEHLTSEFDRRAISRWSPVT